MTALMKMLAMMTVQEAKMTGLNWTVTMVRQNGHQPFLSWNSLLGPGRKG
jgi:hypothetical protein